MDISGANGASSGGSGPQGTSEVHHSIISRYWSGGKFQLVDLPLLMMTCSIVAGALVVFFSFVVFIILRKCRDMRRSTAPHDSSVRELNEEKTSIKKDSAGNKRDSSGSEKESAGNKMASILSALQTKMMFAQKEDEVMKKDDAAREQETSSEKENSRDSFEDMVDSVSDSGSSGLEREEATLVALAAPSGLIALSMDETDEDEQQSASIEHTDEADPSIPQYGRLWFSIVYNEVSQKLFIRVIKAKYLKPRDRSNTLRDPFVKVFLLPDEFNRQESKIVENTLAPHFDQIFEFTNIRSSVLKMKTVRISVYDIDKTRVSYSLGHVIFPLLGYDVASGVVIWRDLEPDQNLPSAVKCGELSVSLTHEPSSQTLLVSLGSGRNMQNIEYFGRDHCVHIEFHLGERVIQQMRTTCRTFDSSICYDNESFILSIPLDQLKVCCLVLIIYIDPTDVRSYSDQESFVKRQEHEQEVEIGRLVLGSEAFAHDSGVEHWKDVIANPGQTFTSWHTALSSIQLYTP